jgi:hypothetical protein
MNTRCCSLLLALCWAGATGAIALPEATGSPQWGLVEPVSGVGLGTQPLAFVDPIGNTFAGWRQDSALRLAVRPPAGAFGPGEPSPQPGGDWASIQIGFDPQGDAVVVWRTDGGSLRAAWRGAGPAGQFGPVQNVGAASGFWLSVNESGDALLIWVATGATSTVRTALRPAGAATSFGPAQTVASAAGVSSIGFAFAALDPDRGAVAVWSMAGMWVQSQQSPRPPGSTTTGFVDAIPFAPSGGSPRFAANPSGTALLVWQTSDGGNPARLGLAGSHRPAGGRFGVTQALWNDPGIDAVNPRAAIGAAGHGLVVFEALSSAVSCGPGRISVFAARMTPAGAFAAGSQVSGTATLDRRPDVAVAPDGHALMVWESLTYDPPAPPCPQVGPPGRVLARSADPAGALGSEVDLSRTPGVVAREPRVAIGAAGAGFAVWESVGRVVGAAYEAGALPDPVFASGFE